MDKRHEILLHLRVVPQTYLYTDFRMFEPSSSFSASFSWFHRFPANRSSVKQGYSRFSVRRTLFFLCQNDSMAKRNQNGLLGVTNPKFAFQASDDVFRLRALAGSKEFGDNRHLLLLHLEVMAVRSAAQVSWGRGPPSVQNSWRFP